MKIERFLAGAIVTVFLAIVVHAGTVVVDTNTYNGSDIANIAVVALPEPAVYMFDLVVAAPPTVTSGITTLVVYAQQPGVAGGQFYTVNSSTFTTCNGACTQFVTPDVYVGGNVRAVWTITSGSATVRVTARKVSP
mgnify:CR=1 FL=1